jgi:anti-sigma B factor antagonist
MVPALVPHDPQLHIHPGPDGQLRLSGELDMASTPQLRAALQRQVDAGVRQCVLDLAELTFCDSVGLSTLLWADRTLPNGVVLHQPSRQLRKVLRTTRLEQAFAIA